MRRGGALSSNQAWDSIRPEGALEAMSLSLECKGCEGVRGNMESVLVRVLIV